MVALTRSSLKQSTGKSAETAEQPSKIPQISIKKTKKSTNNLLTNISKQFENLCSNFDHFIVPEPKTSSQFKDITKSFYEYEQKSLKDIKFNLSHKSNSQGLKPLSILHINGFDNEQIWQQLEVFNKPFIDQLISDVSVLSSRKYPLTLNVDFTPKVDKKTKDENISKSILKSNEKLSKNEKTKKVKFSENVKEKEIENKIIDEKVDFFDLDKMEAFLNAQDRKEMEDDKDKDTEEDNEIDYFEEIPSDSEDEEDEDGKDIMYSDFFDPPEQSTVQKLKNLAFGKENLENEDGQDESEEDIDDEELDIRDVDEEDFENNDEDMLDAASTSSDDEDDYLNNEHNKVNDKLKALASESLNDVDMSGKSEFEMSQIQLNKKIEKAERELLRPHNLKWQLSGETTGDVRPENSLLEEHLQFDHVSKPVPQITDETTHSLESIIIQRIKDKSFDDVERKEKPNEKPFEFRRRIMLESEKSKVGLAEVYEQEYLKQQQKLKDQENGGNLGLFAVAGEVEESETRKEIRKLMRSLFRKLDALSSFHYTPKPPEPELKILNNMPAISVEEVTPDTVSDMKLLAPEEVYSTRGKKTLQAKEERNATDKKRARRLKKKKQSIKQQFLERKLKLKAATANKMEINRLNKKLNKNSNVEQNSSGGKKSLSSSTKFFERLQESKDSSKANKCPPKPKLSDTSKLAKKLKL